jgi:hypothetical protein
VNERSGFAFIKVLRAWDVEAGSATEAACLQAWREKRAEIVRERRVRPRLE